MSGNGPREKKGREGTAASLSLHEVSVQVFARKDID
jgi:hypothetical protein